MKLVMATLLFALASNAQARTYHCVAETAEYETADVKLECDSSTCTATGDVKSELVYPDEFSLEQCTALRRAETTASAQKKSNAYFDVQVGACWADYIRVDKRLLAGATAGFASLVKTSGGDTHDSSGYQYVYLKCSTL